MKKRLAILPAVLVLALGTGACGGETEKSQEGANTSTVPSTSAGPTSSAPATPGAPVPNKSTSEVGSALHGKMVKVAECMRAKGFEAEDPPAGSVFVMLKNVKDQNAAGKAMNECRAKHVGTG